MRILIVDDSTFTRALLRRELDEHGDVVEAADGREALDLLATGPAPDVVLVDLLMPSMNGFEFVKALREAGFQCPVAVCTANTQPCVERRVRELGATEFVPKPELLTPGRAHELVMRLVDRRDPRAADPEASPAGRSDAAQEAAAIANAVDAVKDVLGALCALPVQLGGARGKEAAWPSRHGNAVLQMRLGLAGGVGATAGISLPGMLITHALKEQLDRQGGSGPDNVAREAGSLLIHAFITRLEDLLGHKVPCTGPVADPGSAGAGEDGRIEVGCRFSLSGTDEEGVFTVSLDPGCLDEVAAGRSGAAPR